MKLQALLQNIVDYSGKQEIDIAGLTLNSERVKANELFIALQGVTSEGQRHIQQAIQNGAKAILCEGETHSFQGNSSQIPIVKLKNIPLYLDDLAKRFYGEPSKDLSLIGVTGTNGKTTTTFLLAQALNRLGLKTAVLGTLGYGFMNQLAPSYLTTPDPISLQKYLKDLKDQKAKAVVMEVSSHGLEQNRVKQIHFQSAMFTNLTQDHLDYHGNMDAYGRAKQKLFQFPTLERAVINADSAYADKILAVTKRDLPVVLYSLHHSFQKFSSRRSSLFTLSVDKFSLDHKGIKAMVKSSWGNGILRSPLLGEFNLSNLVGVLGELCLQGVPFEDALGALSVAAAPPGRMQRIGGMNDPQIIIDYAHTPDALENALKAARVHCHRRLWCVFGCGGDRDHDKRAKMGDIAGRFADRIVITNDNPRSEKPRQIINDILEGVTIEYSEKVMIEEDRQQAIEYALQHALPIDTILIAGKGHENYQIIGEKKLPFNDAECVKLFLGEDKDYETLRYC
ncbi:MAG: UDP-N-acetylmuramoyl-L-alanyl-D-glutamate--2,6-diaminopimelate ligase [Candidatus Berkiellales bacterium]